MQLKETLEDALNRAFKFPIGDVMRHTAAHYPNISTNSQQTKPETEWSHFVGESSIRYIIIERLVHQCHGGIQRFYKCRGVNSGGSVAPLIDLSENELVYFDLTAHKKKFDELKKSHE